MEVDEENEKKEENGEVDVKIEDGSKEKQEDVDTKKDDVEMGDNNNIDNIDECNEEDLIPDGPDVEGNNRR
jgi:hypothetical protein